MLLYVLFVCSILLCILTFVVGYSLEKREVYKDLKEKHVVVTGGSSGIGKAVAIEAANLGAHVTIIGRDIVRLQSAVDEITKHCLRKDQKIQFESLDVTSNYEIIKKTLSDVESKVGPIFMLINCAGMCKCAEFDKANVDDIKQMIDLNYFGTAYPTRYVLPGMKRRNEGLIVFVSTEAALIGIYGYSAYGAAKWAVRGLAESIFMELIGTNVRLTLAFPPDTDTPGFAQEELTKPEETKLISGSGGLHSAEEVGKKLIMDAMDDQSSADGTDGDSDNITLKGSYSRNMNRVMVSYVQQLKEKFPHLKDNKEYIIRTLAQKMKNSVPPDPPQNYVTYVGGHYRCKFCNTESPTESIAERHYQERHGERYLSCYACGATFRWKTNLYKHEKLNCQSRDISTVLRARALSLGRKGRSRPFIPDPRDRPCNRYSCTFCSATFKHKSSLEPHLRMHRGERPFLCLYCPRAYTSQIAMAHHMKQHGDINFICDHCGKVVKEKSKLVIHLQSHAPQRKYGCEECPRRYFTKADLTVHINSDHRNLPLPFDCKICPKRFARMASLKVHMKKTHGMVIITSRMFARRLPEMTEKQLETRLQQAIVVLKNPDTSNSNIDHYEL